MHVSKCGLLCEFMLKKGLHKKFLGKDGLFSLFLFFFVFFRLLAIFKDQVFRLCPRTAWKFNSKLRSSFFCW